MLDSLPPNRRSAPTASEPLLRRKLATSLDTLVASPGAGGVSLQEHIVPGAPFLFCLLWWVERHGVRHDTLDLWHSLRSAAGAKIENHAGSPTAAYGILRAFARANVEFPDQAFSESHIRTAIVRNLTGTTY